MAEGVVPDEALPVVIAAEAVLQALWMESCQAFGTQSFKHLGLHQLFPQSYPLNNDLDVIGTSQVLRVNLRRVHGIGAAQGY